MRSSQAQTSAFKVGDRVIIPPELAKVPESKNARGVVVSITPGRVEVEFDNEITYRGITKKIWGGNGSSLVLESVYNSPLYKALS